MTRKTLSLLAFAMAVSHSSAQSFLGGVNLAGFEFGISTTGDSNGEPVAPPDAQIAHFAAQGVNVFRIPFGWQYMESEPGAGLVADYFQQFDGLVQKALAASTSPYVILDLHNYGRWKNTIIGADGPSAKKFAALWGALAQKYAPHEKIMFGLMNEPHDMPIDGFKPSLQAAVEAIRAAGANSQYILLPGTEWSHASSYISANKAALTSITDPAGGTDKLIMDLHQYYDGDGSGTSKECTTDHVQDVWEPVAKDLRDSKRKAIVTESGGGSSDSCQTHVKAALASIKANSDVYLGFTAWAAGAFDQNYELSLTPNGDTDTVCRLERQKIDAEHACIWTAAVKPNLAGGEGQAQGGGQKRVKRRLPAQ